MAWVPYWSIESFLVRALGGVQVGDIAWAPYSSSIFAAVTNDGKVVPV